MPYHPLPVRDGLNPTRLVLPHDPASVARWGTALEYLIGRFPDDVERLAEKVAAREVVDGRGTPIDATTPYEPRGFLFLYRDPPADEPPVPALDELRVLHRDENLLVVDKPHLVSTMPRGRWVTQTVLVHLRRTLDLPDLALAHRLDRPTAGVLVLTVRPSVRGAYQDLFQERRVAKVYEAVAPLPPSDGVGGALPPSDGVGGALPPSDGAHGAGIPDGAGGAHGAGAPRFPVTVRSRIVKMRGIAAAQEVPGVPNAESRIDLVARDEARGVGLYRLEPHTGKTHQLRLHMNSLGVPILHDPFWPTLRPDADEDPRRPLQLLARSLTFTDPFTQVPRTFESLRGLAEWQVGG